MLADISGLICLRRVSGGDLATTEKKNRQLPAPTNRPEPPGRTNKSFGRKASARTQCHEPTRSQRHSRQAIPVRSQPSPHFCPKVVHPLNNVEISTCTLPPVAIYIVAIISSPCFSAPKVSGAMPRYLQGVCDCVFDLPYRAATQLTGCGPCLAPPRS